MARKKSSLKAGSVAGPRSPTRISARGAAIPSAFSSDPDLIAFYSSLNMRERNMVQVRILIGKLSEALIKNSREKKLDCVLKLRTELVPQTVQKNPRAAAKRKCLETLRLKYSV